MTESEKQEIVNRVLSALSTNSTTIDQMIETDSCADSDYFENSKGNKVSYGNMMKPLHKRIDDQEKDIDSRFSDFNKDMVKRTTELNISVLYPTSGIEGSNKYTLEGAIAQVESEYRVAGLKVTFVNENEDIESWEYKGLKWVVNNFSEFGAKKILELDNRFVLDAESAKYISYLRVYGSDINENDTLTLILYNQNNTDYFFQTRLNNETLSGTTKMTNVQFGVLTTAKLSNKDITIDFIFYKAIPYNATSISINTIVNVPSAINNVAYFQIKELTNQISDTWLFDDKQLSDAFASFEIESAKLNYSDKIKVWFTSASTLRYLLNTDDTSQSRLVNTTGWIQDAEVVAEDKTNGITFRFVPIIDSYLNIGYKTANTKLCLVKIKETGGDSGVSEEFIDNFNTLQKKYPINIYKDVVDVDMFDYGHTGLTQQEDGVLLTEATAKITFPALPSKYRVDMVLTFNAGAVFEIGVTPIINNDAYNIIRTYRLTYTSGEYTYLINGGNQVYIKKQLEGTYQLSVISDGKKVTISLSPYKSNWDGNSYLQNVSDYNSGIVCRTADIDDVYNNRTEKVYKDIKAITFKSCSNVIVNKINVSQDLTPNIDLNTICRLQVYNDCLDNSYYPMLFAPAGCKALCQWHHGFQNPGGINDKNMFAAIYNNKLAICYGNFDSYNNPYGTNLNATGVTSANYGSFIGLKYRKRLMDICTDILKPTTKFHIGLSMGGLNSMTYATQYIDQVNALVLISAAYEVVTQYYNPTRTENLKAAYGAGYVSLVNKNQGNSLEDISFWKKISDFGSCPLNTYYENNPFKDRYSADYSYSEGDVVFKPYDGDSFEELVNSSDIIRNYERLLHIPILMIHGDSDTTIDIEQATNFLSLINQAGGNKATLITIKGGGHGTTNCYDTPTIIDFLNKYM